MSEGYLEAIASSLMSRRLGASLGPSHPSAFEPAVHGSQFMVSSTCLSTSPEPCSQWPGAIPEERAQAQRLPPTKASPSNTVTVNVNGDTTTEPDETSS